MMQYSNIKSQRELISNLEKIKSLAESINEADVSAKCITLSNLIRDCELVIPVVGGFSAGKSTMLNTLIGEKILPTAIKPETSLAMELHYSEIQRIEAITVSGEKCTINISDIKNLSDNAERYRYACIYLPNKHLDDILPLVLVDMPGFESSIESHNKAILSYLDRGCHYLVLCDITEGTISSSVLRRLREIESYGRKFNIFLSKADLKSSEDAKEIYLHAKEILNDEFGSDVQLGMISNKSIDAVQQAVQSLNPDSLMREMWAASLLDICNTLLNNINLRIAGAEKNKKSIESIISEMEIGLTEINNEANKKEEDLRRQIAGTGINEILASVGRALSSSTDEFVDIIIQGNKTAAEERINEIVRMELITTLGEKLKKMNMDICEGFSHSLQGIDDALRQHEFDLAYINELSRKINLACEKLGWTEKGGGDTVTKLSNLLANPAINIGSRAAGGVLTTGILGAVSGALLPVMGAVLLFLPEILGFIFKDANRERAKEIVRQKLEGEVYPAIKSKLRQMLPGELQKQSEQMIRIAKAQYSQAITEQMTALEKAKANHDLEIRKKEEESYRLSEARDGLLLIMKSINQ